MHVACVSSPAHRPRDLLPQVWLYGQPGASLRPLLAAQPVLITILSGAPPVHIAVVHLLGRVRVDGGRLLTLIDCTFEGSHSSGSQERALQITGGNVRLVRTILQDHAYGALSVEAANLELFNCVVRANRAPFGAAMLILKGSAVDVVQSNITSNTADVSGGALQVMGDRRFSEPYSNERRRTCSLALAPHTSQVEGGKVELRDETILRDNLAPDGKGSSVHVASNGSVTYWLPAPPGRWIHIRQGLTFQHLDAGPEDLDFPYACSPGVIGGTSFREQSGPGCSKPWCVLFSST